MKHTESGLTPQQLGTVEAVLLAFNKRQLPRLLSIRERVDAGDTLSDYDIVFLQDTLREVQACEYFVLTHPDYKLLLAEVAQLFDHITHQAHLNQGATR